MKRLHCVLMWISAFLSALSFVPAHALEKPDFFGAYAVLATGKSVKLELSQPTGSLMINAFPIDVYSFNFTREPKISKIDVSALSGLIVYLDRVNLNSIVLNVLTPGSGFVSCNPRYRPDLKPSDLAGTLLDTGWGWPAAALNVKRLDQDMYYLDLKGWDLRAPQYKAPACNAWSTGSNLAVVIEKHGWYVLSLPRRSE